MNFHEISPEMKAKAMECKPPEEILELAKETGFELSDEELAAVTGGDGDNSWCLDEYCSSISCFKDQCSDLCTPLYGSDMQ